MLFWWMPSLLDRPCRTVKFGGRKEFRLSALRATRHVFIAALLGLTLYLSASRAAAGTPVPAPDTMPAAAATAADGASSPGEADLSSILLGHVTDSDEWEILPGLPAWHLPRGVTVHLVMLWLAAALTGGAFLWAFRRSQVKPRGLANALEMLVLFVRDDMVFPVMGEEEGEKWLPFFTTLFVFLLAVNYLGMIPLFRTATANINVTSALAAMILLLIFATGILRLGALHFIGNMLPEGAPKPVAIFVCFLEFSGLFVKALVLSLRLFANMVAGHLAILAMLAMIFVLSPWFSSLSLPLAVFIYTLEILVALIQALVFTLLSCIFISMASVAHED